MSHKCKIIERVVAGHACYFFSYWMGPDLGFELSLLSEVGQPVIPIFERMIRERGLKLETISIDESPWVITVNEP